MPEGFCVACGERLVRRRVAGRFRGTCPACRRVAWRNPIPGVRAFVERDGSVLLARHKDPPYRGRWDTPGGLMEEGEGPCECLAREVREETGLRVAPFELTGVYNHRAGGGRVLNL